MDLEVAYYNSKLALWEPVIEPVTQVILSILCAGLDE